jgi:hypothetical protein
MTVKTRAFNRDLYVRRCVVCGYDGAMLRGGSAHRCVRCGCDLRKRPARSYAEMEGLIGQPITLDSPVTDGFRPRAMLYRWVGFLVIVLLGFVAMAYLASALVP